MNGEIRLRSAFLQSADFHLEMTELHAERSAALSCRT